MRFYSYFCSFVFTTPGYILFLIYNITHPKLHLTSVQHLPSTQRIVFPKFLVLSLPNLSLNLISHFQHTFKTLTIQVIFFSAPPSFDKLLQKYPHSSEFLYFVEISKEELQISLIIHLTALRKYDIILLQYKKHLLRRISYD